MSSASESASGPTTTCTTLPATTTPCAPAFFSAASSTAAGLTTSVRRRVMQPSISEMLSAPPSPATMSAALDMGSSLAMDGCGVGDPPGVDALVNFGVDKSVRADQADWS